MSFQRYLKTNNLQLIACKSVCKTLTVSQWIVKIEIRHRYHTLLLKAKGVKWITTSRQLPYKDITISPSFYRFYSSGCERMPIDVTLLLRSRFRRHYHIDFNNNTSSDDFGCLRIRSVLSVIGRRETNHSRSLFTIRSEFVVRVMWLFA